jgi:hypothetical protein
MAVRQVDVGEEVSRVLDDAGGVVADAGDVRGTVEKCAVGVVGAPGQVDCVVTVFDEVVRVRFQGQCGVGVHRRHPDT